VSLRLAPDHSLLIAGSHHRRRTVSHLLLAPEVVPPVGGYLSHVLASVGRCEHEDRCSHTWILSRSYQYQTATACGPVCFWNERGAPVPRRISKPRPLVLLDLASNMPVEHIHTQRNFHQRSPHLHRHASANTLFSFGSLNKSLNSTTKSGCKRRPSSALFCCLLPRRPQRRPLLPESRTSPKP
jgi:hypothetical protein